MCRVAASPSVVTEIAHAAGTRYRALETPVTGDGRRCIAARIALWIITSQNLPTRRRELRSANGCGEIRSPKFGSEQ